jgi:lipid-A-disaccharide synthase (EC 2.4.1.182)
VHFVSPSLWAWRGERIHAIREAVSKMLVVFPFEQQLYEDAGIPVAYVGHPLADLIPLHVDTAATRQALGLHAARPAIALLPGSRRSEVARHAPLMVAAAVAMRGKRPDLQFVLPAANPAALALIQQALAAANLSACVLEGQSHAALAACDLALVASGTATLEAALLRKPMVITYQLPKITAAMMRRRAYLPYVGLPNILAGRFVVPELIRGRSDAVCVVAREMLAWFDDPMRAHDAMEAFEIMHHALRQDASARIADAIAPFLA